MATICYSQIVCIYNHLQRNTHKNECTIIWIGKKYAHQYKQQQQPLAGFPCLALCNILQVDCTFIRTHTYTHKHTQQIVCIQHTGKMAHRVYRPSTHRTRTWYICLLILCVYWIAWSVFYFAVVEFLSFFVFRLHLFMFCHIFEQLCAHHL